MGNSSLTICYVNIAILPGLPYIRVRRPGTGYQGPPQGLLTAAFSAVSLHFSGLMAAQDQETEPACGCLEDV